MTGVAISSPVSAKSLFRRQTHQISFSNNVRLVKPFLPAPGSTNDQAEVFSLAEQWQVKDVTSILDDVVAGVNHFHVAAAKANVPRENIALIDKDLAKRLARVGKIFAPG